MDASHLAQAQAKTTALNEDGFRVVAVAYKEMTDRKTSYSVDDESDLTLLGYIAFLDPPEGKRRRRDRARSINRASRSRFSPATMKS